MTKAILAAWLGLALSPLFSTLAHSESLKVENAQVKDKFILIKSVETPAAGWLVVHESNDGKPGDVLGSMTVVSGKNNEVEIPLVAMLEPSTNVILVLHADAGTKGTFDAAEDKPIMDAGKPVEAKVKIK
jgi:hypothetical protein